MSTREREAWEAVMAPPPSTSVALVPLRADRAPIPPAPKPAEGPANVHRYFYTMGYTALAMIVLATFLQPRIGTNAAALFIPGAMMLGLGGLGVLIHVIYKPSMPKLRQGLGAIAALALTLLAMQPIDRIAQEVHAGARIPELQVLADELVRDGRFSRIGIPYNDGVELNGYHGSLHGGYASATAHGVPAPPTLYKVLRRDGISRLDLVRMMRRLEAADVWRVGVQPGFIVFATETGSDLLYVRPGQSIPRGEGHLWRPLGGGWYLTNGSTWLE